MALTVYAGHITTYSSDGNLGANVIRVNSLSLREDATIEALCIRPWSANATVKVTMFLYDVDPLTGLPNNLLATSEERVGLTSGINEIALVGGPLALPEGNYYVGYISDATIRMAIQIFRNFQEYNQTHTYGTPAPDPWPVGTATYGGSSCIGVKYTRADENEYEAFTLGVKDLAGNTNYARNPGNKWVHKYEIPYDAEASKITLYLNETPGAATKMKAYVYADNGAGAPGALLATSEERQRVPSRQWTDFQLGATLAMPAGTYWIGYVADTQIQYPTWTRGTRGYNAHTYANPMSDPFGAATVDVMDAAVYMPLTPTSVIAQSGQPYPQHPGWINDLSNGNTIGWTPVGQWATRNNINGMGYAPNGNVNFLMSNESGNASLYYDYIVPSWQLGDIDGGIIGAYFKTWFHSRTVNDPMEARILAYDASDNLITSATTGVIANNLAWQQYTATMAVIPAFTRKIRFQVDASKHGVLSDLYNALGNVEAALVSDFDRAFVTRSHVNLYTGEQANIARMTRAHVNIVAFPNRKSAFVMILD